MLGLMGLIMAT